MNLKNVELYLDIIINVSEIIFVKNCKFIRSNNSEQKVNH